MLSDEPRNVFSIFMFFPFLNAKVTGATEYVLLLAVKKVAGGYVS